MKNHFIRIFLFLLLIPAPLFSQVGRFYSTEDGLSSTLINQIYQDKEGYIWIATQYGLNKFDGLNFTVYNHNSSDTTSLKNNYIRTISEVPGYGLLIGCYNGLMRYDRPTDSFIEIPMYHGTDRHIPHITHITTLRNGDILFSTAGQGVFILDTISHSAYFYDDLAPYVPSPFVSCIYEDASGILWIGTEFEGVASFNPFTNESHTYKVPEIVSDAVTAIMQDSSEQLFIGTKKHGLMRLSSPDNRFIPVPPPDGTPLSVYSLSVIDEVMLVGCNAQGVKKYNSETGCLEEYLTNNTSYDFSRGKVHCLFEDRDKNLWIGLFHKGIYFTGASGNSFNYCGNRSLNNPIGLNSVVSLFKDSDGCLWVSSDGEGIYMLDGDYKRIRHFAPGYGPDDIPASVSCFYDDKKGNLWLGAHDKNIIVLNKKSGKTRSLHFPDIKNVNAVAEAADGSLFIGTFGSGLYHYNPSDESVKSYCVSQTPNDTLKNELVNNWINTVYIDRDGMVWIGHHKGLSCFNPLNGSFINYRNSNILTTGCITYAIIEDSRGDIWAGTTEGLICFDKKTEKITTFTTADGLPNNAVCAINEDDNYNLWLSTYNGLCRFDMKTKNVVNFYLRDGIQGNEFFHGAFFKDSDGKMYFGGVNGITSFFPDDIRQTELNTDIIITDFIISSGHVTSNTISGNKSVIASSVSEAEVFTLSHQDNTFTVAFSTLQYDKPEQIIYNYRIKELSTQWSLLPPGANSVTYNSLPPGSYTLQVQANNCESLSGVRTFFIFITPPWYRSVWAYCAYVLLMLMFIYGIINYILFRIRHKHEIMERTHAEKLNEAKLQFFINISHEIRTPMTLIINPLEKLIKKNDKENHNTYFMIYRNAQRILRLVNQLMDIRKLDKGQMILNYHKADMVAMIEDMMFTFDYISQKKNISFSFTHDMSELPVWIDINNFDKILMNILSNAFKFTPENGAVDVCLSTGYEESYNSPLKNYFQIAVSDTGSGIDESKIERIFERFYQINDNAGNESQGTGIGLHLCRSLVNLHNGVIYAENRADSEGSRFVIRIPSGCSHLRADQIDTSYVQSSYRDAVSKLPLDNINELMPEESDKKEKAKTNLRVLIAEDEQEICDYLIAELSSDFKVTATTNGKDAYDKIIALQPDIVISDVMMPGIDGFTLCRKIKQNININHIPVILLTARIREEDKMEGMSVGADAYIVKPFNTDTLKSTISNLITNRRLLKTRFSGTQHPDDKINKIQMKSSDEILMSKILKVINDNIDNSELNVQMLADNVGLSRVHIHRKLKELTNLPARDFIRNIRLKQAASLLTEKNLNISEVAYATGFYTLSHFSTSFKELYGMSPSDYKQAHSKTKENIEFGAN